MTRYQMQPQGSEFDTQDLQYTHGEKKTSESPQLGWMAILLSKKINKDNKHQAPHAQVDDS